MTVISPSKSLFNFSCEYVNHYLKSLASFFSYSAASLFLFVIFVLGFLLMCPNGKRHYILGGVYCCFPVPHLAIALLYLPSLSCIYQSSSLLLFALFYHPGFVLFIEPLMFEHFCSISLLIVFSILSHFPLHLSSCLSCTHSPQQPFRDSHMWFIVVVIPLRPHIPLSCRDIISS